MDPASANLIVYGPLGVFCALEAMAIVWLVKAWREDIRARIESDKANAAAMMSVLEKALTSIAQSDRSRDAQSAALHELAQSVERNTTATNDVLSKTISKLRGGDSTDAFRAVREKGG